MILSRGQVEYIVGLAITAPSVLNTQPWRFFAHADAIDVLAVPARGLPIVDPAARETYISCGAAVFNLRLGIGELRRRPWSGCCRIPRTWRMSPTCASADR